MTVKKNMELILLALIARQLTKIAASLEYDRSSKVLSKSRKRRKNETKKSTL